jgi:hypothetical protein
MFLRACRTLSTCEDFNGILISYMTSPIEKPLITSFTTPVRASGMLIESTPYRPKHPASRENVPSGNACYPYGEPEDINYDLIDPIGRRLIKELNMRPWISTVSYCSGHPQDRPIDEETAESTTHYMPSSDPPKPVRWNFYEELYRMSSLGADLPEGKMEEAQDELAESSITEFNLSVHVLNHHAFVVWIRTVNTALRMFVGREALRDRPIDVRLNLNMRRGMNYIITWPYFTVKERTIFHEIMLGTLDNIPV